MLRSAAALFSKKGYAATSVRDGFLTAYFEEAAGERPRVIVYDTGTESIAEALTQAATQGADFIVGPLTREEVVAAADFAVGSKLKPELFLFFEDALDVLIFQHLQTVRIFRGVGARFKQLRRTQKASHMVGPVLCWHFRVSYQENGS